MEQHMDTMRCKTCCFAGHGDLSLAEQESIARKLEQTVTGLIQSGVRYFGAGGGRGFDTLAAQTVLKLREQYPHIRLILVLPCKSQTRGWWKEDIQKYEAVMAAADKIKYVSQEYRPNCMVKRSRHLVDHSGICICYLRDGSGSTAYTVDYARKNGVPVTNLRE